MTVGLAILKGVDMKALRLVLFVLAMLASGVAWSDEAAKNEAAKLLDTMGMETMLERAIETSLDMQIKQQPSIAPYKDVMLAFLRKYMSYKSLKPEFVEIYATEFTASELKEMRAFYETPTGKKAIAKMPELYNKGAQIGSARVQEHLPELKEMIQAESAKMHNSENRKSAAK